MSSHKTPDNDTAIETIVRSKNLALWLELEAMKLGTEEQRLRHAQGGKVEDELRDLARTELFKPFTGFQRWASSHKRAEMVREMKHAVECAELTGAPRPDHPYTTDTAAAAELSRDEADILKAIRRAAELAMGHPWLQRSAGRVGVQPLTHWLTCTECKSEVSRSSARVSIEWAGRVLVREYAL